MSAVGKTQGVAIKDTWLRIPKGSVPSQILLSLCTHTYSSGNTLRSAKEVGGTWVLPREVIQEETLRWIGLEVRRVGPRCRKAFQETTRRVDPEKAQTERQTRLQRQGIDCLLEARGGIVQIPPGTGKTAIGLYVMQHWQVPALVVTHTQGLQDQWKQQAQDLLGLPENRILLLGGKGRSAPTPAQFHQNLARVDLTLATVQTLRNHPNLQYILSQHIGLAIYDEVHHLQARTYQQTLPISQWYRVGFSATVTVEGLEAVFLNHLGPVVFKSEETDLVPTIYPVHVPISFDEHTQRAIERPIFLGKEDESRLQQSAGHDQALYLRLRGSFLQERREEAMLSRTLSATSAHPNLHEALLRRLRRLALEGRRQLVLSSRKEHLKNLYQVLGDDQAVLIIDEPGHNNTTDLIRTRDIVLATFGKLGEGIDRDDLDTLHVALPWSGYRPFIQGTGRIVRSTAEKKTPEVYLYIPQGLPRLERMCRSFLRHARRYHYPIRNQERFS
jgi:superfamily II DNA or RNA helicase